MTRTPSEFTDIAIGSRSGDPHDANNSAADFPHACCEARKEVDLLRRTVDAMPGHFAILDVRVEGAPIVFVNVALARDYGYEAAGEGPGYSSEALQGATIDEFHLLTNLVERVHANLLALEAEARAGVAPRPTP